jgi:hypothetical protein
MPNDDTPEEPNLDNDTRRASVVDEAALRRELQLLLLREGYTQDDARDMATGVSLERVAPAVERMREDAMRFPERQILPPGAVDLADVKSQREDAVMAEEEKQYFLNQDRLAATMAMSFSVDELPTAALQALLDVLEDSGIDRLKAMNLIIERVEVMQKMHLHSVEGS